MLERSTDGIHWEQVTRLKQNAVQYTDHGLLRHTSYWYRVVARSGDRVQETANGATTFVLDLNAGLTQVLADGTHTDLYGNRRIAQQSASDSAYFLGDALSIILMGE